MPQLAARTGRAKPSAIMQVAEKAKRLKAEGRDIISFSIGVPNFLPGPHVYAAAREALDHDSGQYGSNRGSDALLDAFIGHLDAIGLTGYTRANCASGIGAKHVLYTLAEILLDEGDGFAFATPYWTTYLDIGEIVGADIQLMPCPPEQDYKLTPAQLDEALATHKPKVFLFNNPSNPTGMVYTRDEVAALTGPQDVPAQKNAEFQAKRDQVLAAMAAIPGVVCPRPQGAFYVFPDISCAFGKSHNGVKIQNDVDFCSVLLEAKGVACVPGSAFGEPRAMRISYTCPTPQLAPGLLRIQQFFAELA